MQIEMFKVFSDVVESESFSKAAEANGITQSAVSQQIRALEEKFKVTLIDRGKRGFHLTHEGEAFLEASREILHTIEDLDARLQKLRDVLEGDLRLATVFSIGLHELPPYLKRFRKAYPRVRVDVEYLRSAQVYAGVLEGRVDVGLVAYPSERRGLEVVSFWKDKLVLICAPTHRLAKRSRVKLRELDRERFIAFNPDLPTRKAIDQQLRSAGVAIEQVLEFDNIETIKRAVEIENGISIVPETTIRNEARSGHLIACDIDDPEMYRPLGALVKRRMTESPVCKQFLELLQSVNLGGILSSRSPAKGVR